MENWWWSLWTSGTQPVQKVQASSSDLICQHSIKDHANSRLSWQWNIAWWLHVVISTVCLKSEEDLTRKTATIFLSDDEIGNKISSNWRFFAFFIFQFSTELNWQEQNDFLCPGLPSDYFFILFFFHVTLLKKKERKKVSPLGCAGCWYFMLYLFWTWSSVILIRVCVYVCVCSCFSVEVFIWISV